MKVSLSFRHFPGRPAARRCFTLVEMIVVMAIMGVLIALALPALEKMTVGSSVNAGGNMIASQLQLARGYAISNRCRVAVVFPDNSSSTPDNLRLKSVLVCKVDGSNNFLETIPNTKVEMFPVGAFLARLTTDPTNYDGTGTLPVVTGVPSLAVTGTNYGYPSTLSGPTVVYTPRGDLDNQTTLYLTIAEGELNGTSVIVRNKNNWRKYEINGFTGRVNGATP